MARRIRNLVDEFDREMDELDRRYDEAMSWLGRHPEVELPTDVADEDLLEWVEDRMFAVAS